jgi:hypothetical protein
MTIIIAADPGVPHRAAAMPSANRDHMTLVGPNGGVT